MRARKSCTPALWIECQWEDVITNGEQSEAAPWCAHYRLKCQGKAGAGLFLMLDIYCDQHRAQRHNALLPSRSSHSSEQRGQGRRCQALPRGELVRHLWRVNLGLRTGDQACYCLGSQSRFGDGLGLVPEWAVPGPTPCRGAEGGSMERKARARTLLPAHLPPVPSFSS